MILIYASNFTKLCSILAHLFIYFFWLIINRNNNFLSILTHIKLKTIGPILDHQFLFMDILVFSIEILKHLIHL